MNAIALEPCFACGGAFPAERGPTHAYLLSTPGCWAAYGLLLAREYENPALFGAAHRLTVDAYALQHPGDAGDKRAVQSVWLHYVSLHLVLERCGSHEEAVAALRRLAGRAFPALPARPPGFAITHADVLALPSAEHVATVRRWARCAYQAWEALRGPAETLLAEL